MVRGLCVIRGVPTPVVDTTLLFDEQPAHCDRLVTIRTGKRTIALAAEAILGVQAIRTQDLEQLPPLLSGIKTIAAMKLLDEELVFFLHAARVVPDEVLDRCLAEGAPA